jgi:DNA mismatch repair ATPase MutL
MSKIMPVQDYLKLTNSDKLEIERLLFETVKEEMENLYSFLTVEKIEFNNYWERLDENVESWKELSGFVISRGKTYLRLPNISEFMESEYNNINFTKTLYDIQENVFEFFGLSNTVMGVIMAWGDEDYFD